MREVTFKSVLHGVALRLGLDPGVNLQPNKATALAEYISSDYREAYELFDWPEAYRSEERTATGGVIPWTATEREALGIVHSVWKGDPLAVDGTPPEEVAHILAGGGIQLLGDDAALTSAWVVYRPQAPAFSATEWDDEGSYAVGDVVLYSDGYCYRKKAAGEVGVAPTVTSVWERVPFLYVLAEAVKLGARAAALDEEEQFSSAEKLRKRRNELLEQQAMIVMNQSGRSRLYRSTAAV